MRLIPILAAPALLAACTAAETSAFVEDPSAFACRERAAGTLSVAFEDTAAQPINTDIFGTQNYNVEAAGQTFRCSLDSDGDIITFSRV